MNILEIQKEIKTQLSKKEVMDALVVTTFKGLSQNVIPRAIMEGMMRGFTFKDFLEKNIYAIPFRDGYSLVTSIDYARKVGMRSGIVGKSAPIFEENEGRIASCSVTVKRKIQDYVGEYTATVYFNEYSTGKNLWIGKPRTMLAKVAEMHALRMACPEELAQNYIQEELENDTTKEKIEKEVDLEQYKRKLEASQNIEELKTVWVNLPIQAKQGLEYIKEQIKKKYEDATVPKQRGLAGSTKG